MAARTILISLIVAFMWRGIYAVESDTEVVLVPAVYYDVPGGFGSNWSSVLWVTNGLDRPLSIYLDVSGEAIECVSIPCGNARYLAPGASTEMRPDARAWSYALPARLLYVRRGIATKVWFSLRVQDSSRATTTWGTSIPVVRESDLIRGETWFAPIPIAPGFRQSIRIYRFTERSCDDPRQFTVRLFDAASGRTIRALTLPWIWANGSNCSSDIDWAFPWYTANHSLTAGIPAETLPATAGIEVIPPSDDVPYWAVVTVTSDVTQHVTVVLPDLE
ncbi:MAG: hypothetical protein WBX15_13800 [Thermoanaerobaculia bacterium]